MVSMIAECMTNSMPNPGSAFDSVTAVFCKTIPQKLQYSSRFESKRVEARQYCQDLSKQESQLELFT